MSDPTDVDIQRGLFAGFAYRRLSLTTYVFNLDQSEQTGDGERGSQLVSAARGEQ